MFTIKSAIPIRDKKEIELIKTYLKGRNYRDYLLFVIGINSNLRISDLLNLKVEDVLENGKIKEYIEVKEKKTSKTKKLRINKSIEQALKEFFKVINTTTYLFESRKGSGKPISRQQAHKILADAGDMCGLKYPLSPHSLRKTWGYNAWKNGIDPVLIMQALNHSSLQNTMRYLGIQQQDLDNIYINLTL